MDSLEEGTARLPERAAESSDRVSSVLLVEPDHAFQKRIRKALAGTKVVVAAPNKVIAEAERTEPQVILLDVALPAQEGFSLLQELQTCMATNDIPILFLTAQEGPDSQCVIRYEDLDLLPQCVAKLARESKMRRSFRQAFSSELVQNAAGASELTHEERSVLEEGGFPLDGEVDPTPFAQREAKYQAILASSLTTDQAAKRLQVNASRVRQRLLAHPQELYGIRHENVWRLPAFQFRKKGLVPNIDKVIARLPPRLDPVAVEGWFRRPNLDLEDGDSALSPVQWLAQGKSWQTVAELAEDL